MSRLTCALSGVTYVLNSDTLISTTSHDIGIPNLLSSGP